MAVPALVTGLSAVSALARAATITRLARITGLTGHTLSPGLSWISLLSRLASLACLPGGPAGPGVAAGVGLTVHPTVAPTRTHQRLAISSFRFSFMASLDTTRCSLADVCTDTE